jgi:DNA-binding PadR family transcriptional regulator
VNFQKRKMKDMDIPRLSPKEASILQLLIANGEMYGLELVNTAPDKIKRGTVYVTLGRMADKGYVESRQVPGDEGTGGLPRRLFQATGYGIRVLHAWELADSALAFGAIQ